MPGTGLVEMKTIEHEIRERLAGQQLSPESIDQAMKHIKADPLMRGFKYAWGQPIEQWQGEPLKSLWLSAWSSARDWILAQLTASLDQGGE